MEKNIFELSTGQLKDIALSLQSKIKEGLETDGKEVLCLPTYIDPRTNIDNGKVLVLDLGGTNCRVAIVEFIGGKPVIHPENGWKRDLSKIMKQVNGCEREELFKEIADLIKSLDLNGVKSIGYCFSYPCESTLDGDATLLRWTKGVTVKGMVGEPVGKPLMEYLNKNLPGKANFETIKVINDTVASLFAGLTDKQAQAFIGLIVGTGTNMAASFPSAKIEKLDTKYKGVSVPINLESGNFVPPHLTVIDDKIDKYLDTKGAQRFEKAISGMYLGRILEYVFSCDEFEEDFDASRLTAIMSYPGMYKDSYVQVAHQVYERSAKLVAASLAGLILEMIATFDKPIKNIRLSAEGSLFWSNDRNVRNAKFESYKDQVMDELYGLLKEFNHSDIKIQVEKKADANLIGSAVAALS